MIDKLELRLPYWTLFQPQVREFMLDSRHFENSSRTMKSGRYQWVTGLQPIGIDALLHYGLKRKPNDPHEGEHKLELLNTGSKSYSAIIGQVEQTIEDDVDDLEITRIDLCADLIGTPIDWFFDRLRVRYKRVAYEYGISKCQRIGKAGIQTLSAGKRPNMSRAYDKVAEYRDQLRKQQRKRSRDADELTLESEFGVREDAIITRIERQFGGNRIPKEIEIVRRLPRLPEFNPFTNIEILNGNGAKTPNISECGFDFWLTGTRLAQLKGEMGEQQFRGWLNARSSGNSARYLKRYEAFLQPDQDGLLTTETIFQTYRQSVLKQLAA